MAAAEGAKIGLHLQYLLEEMGREVTKPLKMNVDSTGAIGFARNNGGNGRMKHIDIRAAWVQQLRDSDRIKLVQVARTNNEADYFTKILPLPASIATQRILMHDLPGNSQESVACRPRERI